jgi:aspartyl-tRNA(Asn)/glutamyl-tRNA(Gln) amidotransferase subunit B
VLGIIHAVADTKSSAFRTRRWRPEIEAAVDAALAAHPAQVAQYAVNPKVLGFFVGQVMKATQGKANPALVNELLRKKLAG